MKLLSCYIEGYGKIKKRSYTFDEGITAFFEENGEGKTTLASFIKAMLYGLKGYRKGSTEFCDREHFYPFDGGLFGGNLTYEAEGKTYKIERFFGDKSETADSLRVFIDGEEVALLDEPGRLLFGVDRESFERTSFLTAEGLEIKSTSAIHAQLNRFLEGVEEDGGLDDALSVLERAAKVYKKSKAGADKLSAETAEIAKLNEEIENAAAVKLALEGKYAQASALSEEVQKLNQKIATAQAQNEKLSQAEHYESLMEGVAAAKNGLERFAEKYPLGLPTLEETEAVNGYMVRGKELETQLNGLVFTPADQEKLRRLSKRFSDGLPTEAELARAQEDINVLSASRTELQLEKNKTETERERDLRGKFANGHPSKEKIEEIAAKVAEYQTTVAAHQATPAWQTGANKKSSKKYLWIGVLALLICVVGGACFFASAILGGVLLGAGAVTLLADGFLYLNKKSEGGMSAMNPEKAALELRLREIEDGVKAVLLPYGYHSDKGVVFDFAMLQTDVAAYEQWLEEEKSREERTASLQARALLARDRLTGFFGAYGVYVMSGQNFINELTKLRIEISDYHTLCAREKERTEARAQVETAIAENRAKIDGFKQKYALRDLVIARLSEDIRERARLSKALVDGEEKAAAYKAEKGLDEGEALVKTDLAALQRELSDRQSELTRLEREIASDESVAEGLEGYEEEKRAAEERLRAYKHKHKLLTAAFEQLKKADGRLRDRYVKPVLSEFLKYAGFIEEALGESVKVTKDFELRFERNGVERSEKHLSSGQRSICALCFRLALMKNMYRGEQPFLVLDDPFVALDEGHMDKARAVLRELSKDMQMIYFTCHASRKI